MAVKGLIVAIQFLTRLPMPRMTVSAAEFARSIRWFPAVGMIIGALVAAAAWVGAMIDPWVAALLGVLVWVAVTGALHLDGLGDIADAAGAAHKGDDEQQRATLLAVLADPHIGSFGVVTITVQLAAKLVLAHALIERRMFVALLLIPFAARIGPLLWVRILPALHDGLGAQFRGVVRPVDLACCAAVLLVAIGFVPGLLLTPVLILLWAAWLRHRIGGISGDGHGAGIEVTESGLMFAILAIGTIL